MTTTVRSSSPGRAWLLLGAALLVYAALGNWLVLPGYKRFLEHGSSSGGGEGVDLALIWGAVRTILWMLSFHLGALCLAFAALKASGDQTRGFRRWFLLGGLAWIGVWTIPALPGPYTAFFAGLGLTILTAILIVFARLRSGGLAGGESWRIASYFFFALATWDICGLGSVGGILEPSAEVRGASQTLVVAQTSKLIVELALAWISLAAAMTVRRR
jgi:hypothetical protein